jgi:hypothetical protein
VKHALLFYPFARAVWSEVKTECNIQLNRRSFSTPKLWLFEFLSRCPKQEATTLAVTCWHLWDARNELHEEGGSINPIGVAMKIKAYIGMIATYLTRGSTNHRRETTFFLTEHGTLLIRKHHYKVHHG